MLKFPIKVRDGSLEDSPGVSRYLDHMWRLFIEILLLVWEDSVHNRIRICCFRNLVIAAIKTSENYQLDVTTKKELLGMISRSSIGDPREFQSFCDSLTASLGQARLKL